jgi:hypothetical protein
MELLFYLKGDKYYINNDIFYNDFAHDLDNLITFINYNGHEFPLIYMSDSNRLRLISVCLFQIYSDATESMRIFRNKLINKIIEMLNN